MFQTQNRIGGPSKANIIAIIDTNHVTIYFVEIHGARYPRDGVSTNFVENSYLDKYSDLKLVCREYVGERLLNPYLSFTDMKNF